PPEAAVLGRVQRQWQTSVPALPGILSANHPVDPGRCDHLTALPVLTNRKVSSAPVLVRRPQRPGLTGAQALLWRWCSWPEPAPGGAGGGGGLRFAGADALRTRANGVLGAGVA